MLPPSILGESFGVPSSTTPPTEEGILTSTTPTDYAGAIRGLNAPRLEASGDTYEALLRAGSTIPGISAASTRSIEEGVANSARNQTISSTATGVRIVPALANDTAALSILLQLRRLMDIPPLCLYINPTTFSVSHTKVAQFQERTRYGYVYQAWGEELTKVSFSCTIGAFVAGKTTPSQRIASGVQYASKRDSASFQQLMAVFGMYKSGGYIQDMTANATGRRSRANHMVGNTAIEYDQNVYVGHMDSFSYAEEETLQGGGLKFEIEFTAIKVYDVASQKVSVAPMKSPSSSFYNPSGANAPGPGSRLSRTFLASSTQFVTAPTIGGSTPAQPWTGAAVGASQETGDVIFTRRTG